MRVLIIGAGIAGYNCAIQCRKRGAEVILIEKAEIGGTCLNRGCIPTKNLIANVKKFKDIEKLINEKEKVVKILRKGLKNKLENLGIKIIQGEAEFLTDKKVVVKDENSDRVFEADKIVIASGSKPRILKDAKPDGKNILTSDHILNLKEIPEELIIVGGGVIGLEFAHIYHQLGVKIKIYEMMNRILPEMADKDISEFMEKELKKKEIEIYKGKKLLKITKNEKIELHFNDEIVKTNGKVLLSLGRIPDFEDLNLKEAGIEADKKIIVNEYFETNVPHIYAIGDVTGGKMLAHKALHEAIICADNIFGEKRKPVNLIPSVVFTQPECAAIGDLSGEKIIKFDYAKLGRALCDGERIGFIKLVFDKDDILKGGAICGKFASELISQIEILIRYRAKIKDIKNLIFPHPTYSELLIESIIF